MPERGGGRGREREGRGGERKKRDGKERWRERGRDVGGGREDRRRMNSNDTNNYVKISSINKGEGVTRPRLPGMFTPLALNYDTE